MKQLAVICCVSMWSLLLASTDWNEEIHPISKCSDVEAKRSNFFPLQFCNCLQCETPQGQHNSIYTRLADLGRMQQLKFLDTAKSKVFSNGAHPTKQTLGLGNESQLPSLDLSRPQPEVRMNQRQLEPWEGGQA